MRNIEIHKLYKHFKGKLVYVIDLAKDSETLNDLVIYREFDDDNIWIRPLDMFLSEVDHDKYPDTKQKYRFEKID